MRLRLFLSFCLVTFVSIVTVVFFASQSTTREVRTFMLRGGMAGVDELVADLEAYYRVNGSWQGAESLIVVPGHDMGMGAGMMRQHLRLLDLHRNILVDSTLSGPGGKLAEADLVGAIPLSAGGRVVGYLLPEGGVGFTGGDQTNLLRRLNRGALLAAGIAGLLSLVLAWLLAYRLLRPVRQLTRAAQNLAAGDLSQRVPVSGDDEVGQLGSTFNRMAEALEQAEAGRRAMTADIAHELRTPLAVQRAHLEAIQDGVYPLALENLQPILDQNLLLTRLVEDLRTLALADAGQLELTVVPTDLGRLVRKVVEKFAPQAASRQVTLDLNAQSASQHPGVVHADPGRVEQILGNLLANALRYTPESGRIDLELTDTPGEAVITVHDSGQGVPAEALDHIFERFYRADRSRNRAEGGSGLGLAIARQLAEAHRGTLTAANHPEGGAVFTLRLPLREGEREER